MKEVYKDVPGYDGYYQASNKGNIRSLDRVVPHEKFGTYKLKGRVLKMGSDSNGYNLVGLSKDNKGKMIKVATLVAMAFLNHKPNGKMTIVVDHINNINTDDRLDNLQLISNRENGSKDRKNGSSKYVGVAWLKETKKWRAMIRINGRQEHLGHFANEKDASEAYQKRLIEINSTS